jgi:23S rRNA (adenine2503-C2)-methyltransferase
MTPYGMTREELSGFLEGEPSYRVDQVWHGLYDLGQRWDEMTNLPRALRERLERSLTPALSLTLESKADRGETIKWLWSLPDGARIETVLMHYADRSTVCVSSQAGCAMGCTFCATGQAGFRRHLTTAEILEQVAAARRASGTRRLSNVVFMGMGEPLANLDAVWTSVERINRYMGVSARHITLSTVGVVPGIRRLSRESLPVNLAVSLHAANDELRNRLVPINKRYPLTLLMEACRQYLTAKGRRLSFEWACIHGVNDRPVDAAELASLARPLGAHVNLIPLNPTPGYPARGSSPADVRALRDELVRAGVNATIRRNRGTEIDAACGQLAAGATGVEAPAAKRRRQLTPN